MIHSTPRFPVIMSRAITLLLASMFLQPVAYSQPAGSKGQKVQAATVKTPQKPATNALPSKSIPVTPTPKQTTPASPTPNPQHPAPFSPSTLNPQPSTPKPLRLALTGLVSAAMQQQAAHVDVEASAPGNTLPVFWRGNARTPAFGLAGGTTAAPQLSPSDSRPASSLRKAAEATLTRLHPFATPGTLTLHPDGTPIVRWESVDAALRQAGQAGEEVIFDVPCPAALSSEGWRALAEAIMRRYHENSPVTIARWEAALSADQAVTRYEPFARLARSLYPDTPVGWNLLSGEEISGTAEVKKQTAANLAESIRRVARVCAQNKVPLDSLAWHFADTPPQAAQQVERIRRELADFPTLKKVFLLPTLPVTATNVTPAETGSPAPLPFARPVSFVARLLATAATAPPNPLLGALLEEPTPPLPGQAETNAGSSSALNADATTNSELTQTALALLNRMAGTRLRAQSDDGSIGCLATRSQSRTFVLLWREPLSNHAPVRPSRIGENSNALIVVRLHHLRLENSSGLRITQTDCAQASAEILHPVFNSLPTLKAASSDKDTGSAELKSPLPPTGAADTFWSGNGAATVPPGELEAPVLLEPGSVCLLEMVPLQSKNPIAVTLTMEAGNAAESANIHGGDLVKALLTVRNLSPRPQNLDMVLASPFRDLLPQGTAHLKPGLIPANGGRAFQFDLHAPVLSANAIITLNARIGENAISLTFPVQAPLQAALESPRADVESGTGRANARIRLTNRSRVPLYIHLQADATTGTSVQVPPGGKPVVIALAMSPPMREPGLYSVPLRVESSVRVLQTLHPVIGVPVLCPYAVAKPVIDGDLREWTGNAPLGMGRAEQARGKAWGGPTDVSGYAYAQWDEQFFYFACAVTDDVFTSPPSANDLMQGDCVLFALAATPRPNSLTASRPYAKFGMAVIRNSAGASVPVLVRLMPATKTSGKETTNTVKNARIGVRREDTRTFYEAAIPWSELLPGAASSASPISLSILVNDVDGTVRGSMEWGSGLYGSINPLLFPPLRLVKQRN